MTYEIVIPVIVSFAISALLGPIVIPFLRRLKVGQTERKELESHLKKNGTPTMGGLMILASIIITSVFYVKDYPKIVPILFMTVGFGVIGFLDDYLKVVLRRSDGLLAWQKMLCQIVVTTVFAVYMGCYSDVPLTMLIPFSGGKYLDLGWGAFPVLYLAVIGTVNGTNFTDGLDGLASSVTIMVATFFSVVAIGTCLLYTSDAAERMQALRRSPVRLWVRCLDFCCLMSIRQVFSWEIPDHWRSADLWSRQPI